MRGFLGLHRNKWPRLSSGAGGDFFNAAESEFDAWRESFLGSLTEQVFLLLSEGVICDDLIFQSVGSHLNEA